MPALLALALAPIAAAQTPPSSELLRDIEHLQVVGSVLYVAAHPDDENTRLLHWLAAQRGVRTAYLSMTRGGGGQNLIGTEQSELLGVVRTGELLAARSIDGAEQRFTRMRDFGYSKSPEETLAIWGHDEALADVVLAIRTFRPDVIVTRFSSAGGGHGHHTASALLAAEAFEAAADPARFPVDGVAPWQADRIVRNQSSWRLPDDFDPSAWPRAEVGTFDPRTGRSVGEVAADSRTMHKSQGFGSAPEVGALVEYFENTDGTALAPGDDLLVGLDLTWSRFEGTRPLQKALDKAAKRFDPEAPHGVLPDLARAHALLQDVPDPYWRTVKTAELEQVMLDCAGLWMTARAEQPAVAPGQPARVTVDVVNRSPVLVEELTVDPPADSPGALPGFGRFTGELTLTAPDDLTVPHWLSAAPTAARYTIDDPRWRNAPDTPASLRISVTVQLAGVPIETSLPVTHAWTDRVHGERLHPVEVLPPATASFEQRGLLLPEGASATTRISVVAPTGPATGTLTLTAPDGVTVEPAAVDFDLPRRGAEQGVTVELTAAEGASPGPLSAAVEVDGRTFTSQQHVIDYPHLPRRTVLSPARMALSPVPLDRGGVSRVGYVMGSGDAVPEVLRSLGYRVDELDEAGIAAGDLARYDAIVLGIRAYNTRPRLMALNPELLDYAAAGGRVIVQYNTNSRWTQLEGPIGPAPLTIGRGRVTDETAALVALDSAHPVLKEPNALGPRDFDGWVQERGLYFATEWGDAWTPIFASHDPGEPALEGSTLVAEHGDGVFVYTGLSFFRQLPAGVPGAVRLFANLLALSPAEEPQ